MIRNIYALLTLCSFTNTINYVALYGTGDCVIELTTENFDKMVLKDKSLWLIQFYAPWCRHCINFKYEYKKAAKGLIGLVKVGAVNIDEQQKLANRYNIKYFPTIKFFGRNKQSPINYNGTRNAEDIVQAGMEYIQLGK